MEDKTRAFTQQTIAYFQAFLSTNFELSYFQNGLVFLHIFKTES